MPSRVPMKICSLPSDSSTAMTESPSSMPIAMMPPARGLLNSDRSVFLIDALARAHDDELLIFLLGELLDRQQRGDLLARLHRDEVGDRLALAARADVRDLVDLQPVARGRGRRRS